MGSRKLFGLARGDSIRFDLCGIFFFFSFEKKKDGSTWNAYLLYSSFIRPRERKGRVFFLSGRPSGFRSFV